MPGKSEIKADRIEITVSGGFKTEHVFHTAGGVLGVLELRGSRSEGWFRGIDDLQLHFEKTSFWKSRYQLSDQDRVLGAAQPVKALSRKLSLRFEGQPLLLVPGGSKLRSWRLLDSLEKPLLEIQPRRGFKRGALIRVGSETALSVLVFAYCLVSRRWQEENAAA